MGRKGPKPKTYNHFQMTLDKFLGSKNLWRKQIAKDGSCLFRAVAEQVWSMQAQCMYMYSTIRLRTTTDSVYILYIVCTVHACVCAD